MSGFRTWLGSRIAGSDEQGRSLPSSERSASSDRVENVGLSFVSGLGLGGSLGLLVALVILVRRRIDADAQVGPTRIELLPQQTVRLHSALVLLGAW